MQRIRKMEKEKAGNIRTRKISFFAEEMKTENEKEENIWTRKISFFVGGKEREENKTRC